MRIKSSTGAPGELRIYITALWRGDHRGTDITNEKRKEQEDTFINKNSPAFGGWAVLPAVNSIFYFDQAFFPMNPMMTITRLMPMTAPETLPTVCINAVGSLDVEAMDSMKR
jgi:hypothetical protein